MTIYTETLSYEADGLQMRSQLFRADTDEVLRPGVLVFPEAFGLNEYALRRARQLAEIGFVALACDLHGMAQAFDKLDDVLPIIGPLYADPEKIRARCKGALDALRARGEIDKDRVAAIGYCFGGSMALELGRSGADVRACIGFHCGLTTAAMQGSSRMKAKLLVCLGADDPVVDRAQRLEFEDEMRQGGVDWQMDLYGGVLHSFTNPAADSFGRPELARYDALADARSWAAMTRLFEEVF